MKNTILFVCTENICRSPIAEVLLKDAIERKISHISSLFPKISESSAENSVLSSKILNHFKSLVVQSAGTHAKNGMQVSKNSDLVVKEIGLNLSNHSSQIVTKNLLDKTFAMFTMTKNHLHFLHSQFGTFLPKHSFAIQEFLPKDDTKEDISDPFGCHVGTYLNCRNQIAKTIPKILEFIEKTIC